MKQFIMTVGVQYGTDPERSEIHPLGLTGNGYTIIEAPDKEVATAMAFAITGRQFSFVYDREEYGEEELKLYHPGGEELRIAWQVPS